jgi:hypothetical protein
VVTPLRPFDDCVLLEIEIEHSDSRPRSWTRTFRMWLANGVGPVQVQLDGFELHRLVAGVVGGNPIQ